jgi:hypothetical protein
MLCVEALLGNQDEFCYAQKYSLILILSLSLFIKKGSPLYDDAS